MVSIADDLGTNPNWLMACMAFETGTTFDPAITNRAGSGATGLIQFMPSTAEGLGTTTGQLAKMSAVEQLAWVKDYFRPYAGRLNSLADVYMAILWPSAIGASGHRVLWSRGNRPVTYRQNSGLDTNNNHSITKAEASGRVTDMLVRGLQHARTVQRIEDG